MGINFTAGAVFGRKLYGGTSQQKVVDLGKPATRLGKACREQRECLGSRAPRLGRGVATSKLGDERVSNPGIILGRCLQCGLVAMAGVRNRRKVFDLPL
jgi:hypothetical protein